MRYMTVSDVRGYTLLHDSFWCERLHFVWWMQLSNHTLFLGLTDLIKWLWLNVFGGYFRLEMTVHWLVWPFSFKLLLCRETSISVKSIWWWKWSCVGAFSLNLLSHSLSGNTSCFLFCFFHGDYFRVEVIVHWLCWDLSVRTCCPVKKCKFFIFVFLPWRLFQDGSDCTLIHCDCGGDCQFRTCCPVEKYESFHMQAAQHSWWWRDEFQLFSATNCWSWFWLYCISWMA